ncbi:MAG TPA: hypothetical protein DC048_06120, partial [Planctomycetaceae bacterium]|nr:hypothetical protein [Planctomycetaceae bacterium]
ETYRARAGFDWEPERRSANGFLVNQPQRMAALKTCLATLTRLATVAAASRLSLVVRFFFRRP